MPPPLYFVVQNTPQCCGARQRSLKVTLYSFVKDRADVFPFEDREINYSCRKLIEYTGEELNDVTMYWAVEEFLYPGEYRVDIFADNYKIGTRSFTLKQ